MPVPSRVIAIMQLFVGKRRVWTADAMGRAIGVSTSTAYRYVKELCAAGFLDPVAGAGFTLGPAIIQYDYLLRSSDPLIRHARPVMRALIESFDPRVDVILCRRFRDCVLCIHQENGPGPHPPTSYARGVAMPLFLGATSKVILANLPGRGLQKLYLDNEERIRASDPGQSWKNFKEQLRHIRRDGYCLTEGEIVEGRTGLAAPVFRDGQIVASISIVLEGTVFAELAKVGEIHMAMKAAAADVSSALDRDPDGGYVPA